MIKVGSRDEGIAIVNVETGESVVISREDAVDVACKIIDEITTPGTEKALRLEIYDILNNMFGLQPDTGDVQGKAN